MEERIVNCPYNKNHTMAESRLMSHINNGCKEKDLYGHLYTQCTYNSIHIVREEHLQSQLEKCPDRNKVNK